MFNTPHAGAGLVCKDTNACANKPCSSLVSCTDQAAPGTGFSCGSCPAGYKGDGIGGNGCTDADDCASPSTPSSDSSQFHSTCSS